jgi:hypothetical protein
MDKQAYIRGFMTKLAVSGGLTRNLLSLSDSALARLSPLALEARSSGKIPIYIQGPKGSSLFGVRSPMPVQPSMADHLKRIIRDQLRSSPGDVLAARKPGRLTQYPYGFW